MRQSLIPCFLRDQGSPRRPKGIVVYAIFSVPPSGLVMTQVKEKPCNLPTPNISFSPSSLHFRPDFSLRPTFSGHFSLLPIMYLPPLNYIAAWKLIRNCQQSYYPLVFKTVQLRINLDSFKYYFPSQREKRPI